EVAETLCRSSGRERTSAFCYAVGWTQHSVGVQYIRTAAIVQLLLGNIGRPGGGILALRGHASIQGSTDIPTLYDTLPGYIPMPHAQEHQTLSECIEQNSSATGFWGHMDAYVVSLLKAWWGDAAHTEKDGSFTNTQRLLQCHTKAVEPRDDCRTDLWFYFHLGRIIRERLATSTDPRDRPLLDLTWDYPVEGEHDEPRADAVLREVNGRGPDRHELSAFTELRADGSTACGCWIYCGAFADGVNQTARRKPGREQSWVAPEWGWAWPANRRLLYNRASADPEGRPWSTRKRYVWWDAAAGEWTGADVPDFPVHK